ncbi:MAG: D-2-hydroxyacid dehydrogenase [Spirochaetales bacterium]|nr:D-2-hydroxyacid dehydrogenase [Spirochaetales bacterium]
MNHKIVVLDGYTENPGDLSWDCFKAHGDFVCFDRTPVGDVDEIVRRIGDADIVITNKTPINKEVFDRCPNIRFVALLATGYNVVDVNYAKEKGIPVSNVPTYGTDSVSQFAIALLLELCHHIGHHSEAVHNGRWENNIDWCFWDYPLIELASKTIGIIGFGRIGHRTGEIAKALNMNVIVNDNFENPKFVEEGFKYVTREELYRESDVIALHCPLFPDTMGLINKDTIAQMKDGVLIVNNSRGQLVVEQDLADALNSGKVGGAALDVVSTEPIKGDNPLLKAKNCIITPHMSWGAKEARERIMSVTSDNVKTFIEGKPQNVVNK